MSERPTTAALAAEALEVVASIGRASADPADVKRLARRLGSITDDWLDKQTTALRLQPPEARRLALWQLGAPVFEKVYVPALCRHIVDRVVQRTDAAPDAVAAAQVLDIIARRFGRAHPRIGRAVEGIAESLRDHAISTTTQIAALIDSRDAPDVNALALDLLKIDSVRWVLETLQQPKALGELTHHSRRLARLTLMRSSAVIDGFVTSHDAMAMFDAVTVISQIDGLLTVTARLLDALAGGEEERTAFVATDDEKALAAFGRSLTALADLLGRIIARGLGRAEVSATVVKCALRQFVSLHQFSRKLSGALPPEFSALEARLDAIAGDLVERIEKAMSQALAAIAGEDTLTVLHEEATLLIQVLDDLGLGEGKAARLRRALALLDGLTIL